MNILLTCLNRDIDEELIMLLVFPYVKMNIDLVGMVRDYPAMIFINHRRRYLKLL